MRLAQTQVWPMFGLSNHGAFHRGIDVASSNTTNGAVAAKLEPELLHPDRAC